MTRARARRRRHPCTATSPSPTEPLHRSRAAPQPRTDRGDFQIHFVAGDGITGDRAAQFLEDVDEYIGRGVFWVPPLARWDAIAAAAKSGSGGKTVGELLDGAMSEIERANEELRGVLPKVFNRPGVDERRLAELVDREHLPRLARDRPGSDV